MKPSKDELTFPRFQSIVDVAWDDDGFRAKEQSDVIHWTTIEQVALIFELSPSLAIIEPETYIAFRTKNPDLSVWVYSTWKDLFAAEIGRRFATTDSPPPAKWKDNDSDRCITSFTIWPEAQRGAPLYVNFRKSWWSSETLLAFRTEPNHTAEPSSPSKAGSP